MLPRLLDRVLLPLRLLHARRRRPFVRASQLGSPVVVRAHNAGFPEGEAAYNGLGIAADGAVWAAISTKRLDAGARVFVIPAGSGAARFVADLDVSLSEPGIRVIPQGKVHVELTACGERILGATHCGYYDPASAFERPGVAAGYEPYSGGWFFAIEGDTVVPLAQAPLGEGIITMTVDVARSRALALTWPGGLFLTLDLESGRIANHGPVLGKGEAGSRREGTWVRICRSIAIDPTSGDAFWSDREGRIIRFDGDAIASTGCSLPGAEMWRKVLWHPQRKEFYGVIWDSGVVFRLDPRSGLVEEVGALRPRATLAFALDGDAIHALVPGPGLLREGLQLHATVQHATFHIATRTTRFSGPLRLDDGRWVTEAQSLLLADGMAYTLAWVEVPSHERSPAANHLRKLRRDTREFRSRGYAEEIVLVSFAVR